MRQAAFFAELMPLLEAEQAAGRLTPERACEVIAERFGGREVKIGRQWQRVEIRPTDTPAAVAQRYRVDRSTAHRWVTSWRR